MKVPYWDAETALPQFPSAEGTLSADVVVIGGGITGATAALLLKEAGASVILLERDRCGSGDTSHTSAHLTAIVDSPLHDLIDRHGKSHADAIVDAGFAALHEMASISGRLHIDCGFRWIPGYLCARFDGPTDDDLRRLTRVENAAATLGLDATLVPDVDGVRVPGVRFEHQARFHPLAYLGGLLHAIDGDGSAVYEHSQVIEVDDSPLTVRTGRARIETSFVVMATHVPLLGKTPPLKGALLQSDLYPYSSYVVSASVPSGTWPDALLWDLSDPYTFVRLDTQATHDVIVVGGHDHKTGQAAGVDPFGVLTAQLHSWAPAAKITHRWSGQVINTRDGLPYIGETSPRQFVITGFGGNGFTFGTLGAMMARDVMLGRRNPWSGIFDVTRTHLMTGLWDYVRENADYPYYMIRDRFRGPDGRDLRAVRRGEGRLIDLRGTRVAAYRDDAGTLTVLSPSCPHLGCAVTWNTSDRTWDCPCHGSRFTPVGRVLRGPAERDLQTFTSR